MRHSQNQTGDDGEVLRWHDLPYSIAIHTINKLNKKKERKKEKKIQYWIVTFVPSISRHILEI